MATTHVFAGLTIVTPVAYVAPEFAIPLAAGAILGGLAPDLDLLLDHRRTLHFPSAGVAPAAALAIAAIVVPTSATVALAAFALAAWVHALTDVLGGGPGFDPWENPSDRAVYDHVRGRWLRARRVVRYDGAPEDAGLAVALSVPGLVVFAGITWLRSVILGLVAISIGYALFRRRVSEWLPDWLQ